MLLFLRTVLFLLNHPSWIIHTALHRYFLPLAWGRRLICLSPWLPRWRQKRCWKRLRSLANVECIARQKGQPARLWSGRISEFWENETSRNRRKQKICQDLWQNETSKQVPSWFPRPTNDHAPGAPRATGPEALHLGWASPQYGVSGFSLHVFHAMWFERNRWRMMDNGWIRNDETIRITELPESQWRVGSVSKRGKYYTVYDWKEKQIGFGLAAHTPPQASIWQRLIGFAGITHDMPTGLQGFKARSDVFALCCTVYHFIYRLYRLCRLNQATELKSAMSRWPSLCQSMFWEHGTGSKRWCNTAISCYVYGYMAISIPYSWEISSSQVSADEEAKQLRVRGFMGHNETQWDRDATTEALRNLDFAKCHWHYPLVCRRLVAWNLQSVYKGYEL